MAYSNEDPREIGTKGLSGINTKDGQRRYAERMGIPTTVSEYKMAAAQQGANYAQPIYDENYGLYKVDKNITNPNDLVNLDDARGRMQSSFDQITNGTVKGLALVGTTIGNTLGTFFVGIPEAIRDGDFSKVYDNEITSAMKSFTDWTEEQLPNFYTDDERENPLAMRNLFSANTLGDKFIKNLGFAAGSALVGMAGGSAIRGLSSIPKIAGLVKNASGAAKSTATLLGALLSAVGESSFEAKNTSDEFYNANKTELDSRHQMNLQSIYENYAGTDLLAQMVENENNDYNAQLSLIRERANKAGDGDFLMNMMILPAGNYVQFGKMFSRGFKTAEKANGNLVKDLIKGTFGAYGVDATKARGAVRVLGRGLSEGTEEALQQFASDFESIYNQKYIDNIQAARLDPEAQEQTIDLMKTIGESILYTAGNESTWEQFLIGGLTGFSGVPMVRSSKVGNSRRSPIYMAGNAFTEYNNYIKSMNEAANLAQRMNEVAAKKNYVTFFQGLTADRALENDMEIAAANGDEYNYKNAEFLSLANMVDMFARTGKLNDLKAAINDSFDINDDNDLQSIIDKTTSQKQNEDGSVQLSGPFVEDNNIIDISNPDGKKKVQDILTKQKNKILGVVDKYETISRNLDNQPGQHFTDDQRDELMWLHLQLSNWADRLSDISKDKLVPILTSYSKELATARNFIQNNKGEETGLEDSYDKVISKADNVISFLDSLKDSSPERLADLLFTDSRANKKLGIINFVKDIISESSGIVGIKSDERDELIRSIDDIDKMKTVYNRTSEKLKQYLKEPSKIEKARKKVTDTVKKKERSFKGRNLKDKLNNATSLSEFRETFESAKENPDVKQEVLKELVDSNPIAKNYVDLNEAKQQVNNEIANQKIEDAQTLGDVTDLFTQAFSDSDDAAYFTNISSEPYQRTDYLVNKEQDAEKLNTRHQAAVSHATQILSRYNRNKSEANKLKEQAATKEQKDAADSKKTTEPMPSNEQGGANPSKDEDISFSGETIDISGTDDETENEATLTSYSDDGMVDAPLGDNGSQSEIKAIKGAIDSDSQGQLQPSLNSSSEPHQYLQPMTVEYDYTRQAIKEDANHQLFVDPNAFKPNGAFASLLAYFKDGLEYTNSGKLKPGNKVFIGMDSINNVNYLIAFVKDGDSLIPLNNISGYTSESALNKNIGLNDLYKEISKRYNEFRKDNDNNGKPYVSELQVSVADIMLGKVPYGNQLQPLKLVIENTGDLYTDKSPVFAILRATGLNFGVKDKDGSRGITYNDETLEPLDRINNIGRVYITVPNARRGSETGRNAIPLTIDKFSDDYLSVPMFGENIDRQINNLVNGFTSADRNAIANAVKELGKYINLRSVDIIYDSEKNVLHINKLKRGDDGKYVLRDDGKVQYEGNPAFVYTNESDVKQVIINHLKGFGLRYNVDMSRLNDESYNKALLESNVLKTYASSLESRSSWFILNTIVKDNNSGEWNEVDAIVPQMTGKKKQPVRVTTTVQGNPAPKTIATNETKRDTVNYKSPTITWSGQSYTLDGDKVIDSGGSQVKRGIDNETLFLLAEAAKGNAPTYNGRYAYVIKRNGTPVILDMKNGDVVDKRAKEYKDIMQIENAPKYRETQSSDLTFHLADSITNIEPILTEDTMRVLKGNIGVYFNHEDGVYKSNILHHLGQYKGVNLYGTLEPVYNDRGNLTDWKIMLVTQDGNSIFVRNAGEDRFESVNSEALDLIFKAIEKGQMKTTISKLDSIIKPVNAEQSIKPQQEDTPPTGEVATTIEVDDDASQYADAMGEDTIDLLRKVDSERRVFDKNTETSWLNKVLPNLSGEDRIRFMDGLIPVMKSGINAWGKFDGHMMTISNVAARGTVYHEAFHAVFHMLLDSDKRASILNKAKEYYGRDLDNEELEEMLADDFMNYTIREESILGKISNWFRNLSIKRDNWKSARIHLNNLFRDINNGVYSNIEPQSVTLSRELAKQEEFTQEMRDILAKAPRDEDGRLLAPNGKPSNLTERQYAQVRTKAFKKWFGDWESSPSEASKVVDDNGEPLVVYTGRKEDVPGLFTSRLEGYYFSFSKELADVYASKSGGKTYNVFLNIRVPKYFNENDRVIIRGKEKYVYGPWQMLWDKDEVEALFGKSDGGFMDGGREVVVFNLNQIKSATNNIGAFDSNNPDIRYRIASDNEEYNRYLDVYYRNADIKSYRTKREALAAFNNLKKRYPKARIIFKEGGRISKNLKPHTGDYHVYMNKPRLEDFASPQEFHLIDDGLDFYRNMSQEQAISEAALITQEEREQFISDGHSESFVDFASRDQTILDILKTCSGIDM